MGELKAFDEARYIHGNLGRGMWTFYGGHDPEDYRHTLNEDPTGPVSASQFAWLPADSQ